MAAMIPTAMSSDSAIETKKHIAIYCRVSSDKQQTASQEGDLERWVEAFAGESPVIWYRETSNEHRLMNRPEWNRLEAAMRTGAVCRLVVWKLDRLGRSARKLLELFEQLRDWGAAFYSLKESLDLETPVGRL